MSEILVTGGNGRLARVLSAQGGERVQAVPRSALDVTEADQIARVLDQWRPDAVINTAVGGVAEAELRPDHARLVNGVAPGLIARACAERSVPLIHVSTDYVFGAAADRLWREDDPTSPVNAYGRTKAMGEQAVLDQGGVACVARVAWLFGDGLDFIARLLQGDEETVRVTDQVGSPTPIQPLAARMLALAERMITGSGEVPPILHLAGSPPASRADWVAMAFAAQQAAGRPTPALVRVPLETMNTSPVRPAYSALDCSLAARLFGGEIDWREAARRAETFPGA